MHPWFRVLVGDPTAGRANAGLPVPQAGLVPVEPASPTGHLLKWNSNGSAAAPVEETAADPTGGTVHGR